MAHTVVLVEDHPIVLRGLRALVTESAGFSVVGEATDAAQAVDLTARTQPDVVVVPVRLGGTHSGIELCRTIKSVSRARVLVFTSFTRPVDVQVAVLAGADALVSKTASTEDVVATLRTVTDGGRGLVLGPGLEAATTLPVLGGTEQLTEREDEVLQLITEGLTNPEIAERLSVEVSTVKSHVRVVLRKLGVESRRDLLR